MKQFADLHLQPPLDKREQIEKLICKATDLGYSLVAISLPPKIKQDTILFLRKTCKSHGVDFATRIDLTPKSSNALLKSLRLFRRRFQIVGVNCISKSIARQAAKDHRVDMLAFPSSNPRKRFFDQAEARVACQGVAAFEIDMALLLQETGFYRMRLLSSLRKEVAIAKKNCIPIVISSNACNPLQLRGPNDLANLALLFGMDNVSALNAVSVTPSTIVKRNREKLDSSYVARGVRVVRRGTNCDS